MYNFIKINIYKFKMIGSVNISIVLFEKIRIFIKNNTIVILNKLNVKMINI